MALLEMCAQTTFSLLQIHPAFPSKHILSHHFYVVFSMLATSVSIS
jgi:hypothetical protein